MWARMEAAGDIYEGEYDGMYCVGCEDFKTEDDVIVEGGEKVCPIHHRPVERVKEKNYFFRLKKYESYLLELYEQPDFIRPESRKNEVASFVRGGLRDLSISRLKKAVGWGIPVPGRPESVVYVWIDALTNYLTVLGGPNAVAVKGSVAAETWAASHHLIAKDILRFHAVYWPAMLKSAGLPAPKSIFCHGYLTVKGQKISKSMPATKVDPMAIAADLDAAVGTPVGIELLRYFVLREYALGGDGDFTYEALLQRYESDLGNDLGNLLNRTASMVERHFPGMDYPPTGPDASGLGALAIAKSVEAKAAFERFAPSRALEAAWEIVRAANAFIERSAPWSLAKDFARQSAALWDVLSACCEALRWIASMIAPVMPESARNIFRQLGLNPDLANSWPTEWRWTSMSPIPIPQPLFPRLDPDKKTALLAKWLPSEPTAQPAAKAPAPSAVEPAAPPAAIDKADFDRVDLRAARVLACERVPKTEKLLKLTLDIGTEQRTVVSGIAGAYEPEAMVGKMVVYLANLEPRKIRGVVSQGMILAAGDADVLALTALDRDVPPGTRIR